jgi:hypothetical protein
MKPHFFQSLFNGMHWLKLHTRQSPRAINSFVKGCMACTVALTFMLASAKEPAPVRDCCGDENFVYRPSTERIKITNSAELNKQLADAPQKPEELARLRKAIEVGNYVLQAYVNKDLFHAGSDQEPPEIREGWLKYYAPYIGMDLPAIDKLGHQQMYEHKDGGFYAGVSKNPRHNRMVCPFARLRDITLKPDKALLTYEFIHIARHAGLHTGAGVADHPLELNDKGKVGVYRIALNRDFQYVPGDPDTPDWWFMETTNEFKEQLRWRLRLQTNEELKPKFRDLLTQITNAEKVCLQKELFAK